MIKDVKLFIVMKKYNLSYVAVVMNYMAGTLQLRCGTTFYFKLLDQDKIDRIDLHLSSN